MKLPKRLGDELSEILSRLNASEDEARQTREAVERTYGSYVLFNWVFPLGVIIFFLGLIFSLSGEVRKDFVSALVSLALAIWTFVYPMLPELTETDIQSIFTEKTKNEKKDDRRVHSKDVSKILSIANHQRPYTTKIIPLICAVIVFIPVLLTWMQ